MYSNPIDRCVCVLNKMVDILKQIASIDFVFIVSAQALIPLLLGLNY